MTRFAAFLRAVNVGGRIVKKEDLRRIFESVGLEQVETFLASGNVIFETSRASELESRITKALAGGLGFEVPAFVRTLADVSRIAESKPFPVDDGARLYVGFTAGKPMPSALERLPSSEHAFAVDGREVYWLCRIPMSESKITNGTIEKALGMSVTFRNRNTVDRIAAKWG
jgi:uncharacterized protein (DUF1697 family)